MTQPRVFDSHGYLELEAHRLGGRAVEFDLGQDRPCGLVAREIPGTGLSDLVSVYGYPDLLTAAGGEKTDNLLSRLGRQARERDMVAAYLRLGLSLEVPPPDGTGGEIAALRVDVGEVVAVDLRQTAEALLAGYRKQLRYDITRPHGLMIEETADFAAFHDIYTQNMTRVGAAGGYFFSAEYLAALGRLDGVSLWLARDAAGVVAGGLFFVQGDLVYYHLGATADRALATSPLKHLLHHRISGLLGKGQRLLVLGGGVGGGEDALLRFKRGFSKMMLPVHAMRVILDPTEYARLSGLPPRPPEAAGFFPAYRAPK